MGFQNPRSRAATDMDGKKAKFLKPGKIVILLQGRYAGRKAVVVRCHDEGTNARKYGHCVVVGIDRYPLKVTRTMGPKKVAKRSKVKSFIKTVNYNHLMPTRYAFDGELKALVTPEAASNPTARKEARSKCKKVLEEKYATALKSGKTKWFFQKLRF
eukprot:c2556_g1_i1.p1 GENE.c2556_g1_i1~~c2556_g1_i1.p1  ORF type:complete len:157 (-),score=28.11 c2556_g1_i1:38-508(-)